MFPLNFIKQIQTSARLNLNSTTNLRCQSIILDKRNCLLNENTQYQSCETNTTKLKCSQDRISCINSHGSIKLHF